MDENVPFFTPAQFQLPAGFQQLPDCSLPGIKQEVPNPAQSTVAETGPPTKTSKKKKKIKKEPVENVEGEGIVPKKKLKQEKITEHLTVKKKRDRFNGMPEEEVVKRLLPDHLKEGLDIIIIGINPGLLAAYVGHHYAGPGNHFWKCLYLSELIPEPMNAYQDFKLLDFGIGFTNICARTTRGSADLKKTEIKEGAAILKEKLQKYKPKIAAFNGKGIYEVYCGHKNFKLGKQPEPVEGTNTIVYVMPSSSARCAQLPRAVDKVPFYAALKKIRDYMRGDVPHLNDSEVCFPDLELKIKTEPKTEPVEGQEFAAAKGKKSKSPNPSKTSQSKNIPVSTSQNQPANGMWPVVKQEKAYDASEYGGQKGSSYSNSVPCTNAYVSTQMMPVYQNQLIYSQPNGQSSTQIVNQTGAKTTNAAAPSAEGVTRTGSQPGNAIFYPGGAAQPSYQAQLYPQGSFMQQLQGPDLASQNQSQTYNGQSETWSQFSTYTVENNSPAQATNDSDDSQSAGVRIKTEPQDYGYTEIDFSNM